MVYLTVASHFDIMLPCLLLLPMNMTLGPMFGINEACGLITRKVFDENPHYRSVPELIALS